MRAIPDIIYIDPVGPETACSRIIDNLGEIKNSGTNLHFTHLDSGPSNLEYRYSEAMVIPGLLSKIKKLEKEGAEVIILGCTMQFGYYQKLQQAIGVPVIDPVIAALKYAELLISLREKAGLYVSKKYAFESPPDFKI